MKTNFKKNDAGKLRQRAEKLIRGKTSNTNVKLSEDEMLKLIYELEVHQVELEMQNEELKSTQSALTLYAERYHELYDFAPIGFVTLSNEGTIIEINFFACQMLGNDRLNLTNSQFGFFISDDTKPVFNHFLWKIFTECVKENCEVILRNNINPAIFVRLTGIIDSKKDQCLVTVLDITDQKKTEEELEKWATLFKPKAN